MASFARLISALIARDGGGSGSLNTADFSFLSGKITSAIPPPDDCG